MPPHERKKTSGFTLVELLVVIAIIGLLSSFVLARLSPAREKARFAKAASNAKELSTAAKMYAIQMGFYPPDTSRGWDPGFMQPLPFNPDTGASTIPPCAWCPSGWNTIVPTRWDGPYLNMWPKSTPWKGKYDYNYWTLPTDRYSCIVPPGIYIGIQGDYANLNTIPPESEQRMLNMKLDNDGCLNGEAQVLLKKL